MPETGVNTWSSDKGTHIYMVQYGDYDDVESRIPPANNDTRQV